MNLSVSCILGCDLFPKLLVISQDPAWKYKTSASNFHNFHISNKSNVVTCAMLQQATLSEIIIDK